eukprot:7864716-Pyramimonas_sp.AAC.1
MKAVKINDVITSQIRQPRSDSSTYTVENRAKKRPACLQGALGVLGSDGFAMERVARIDVLESQGWVSCGRSLAVEPLCRWRD